jgi:hypothetical protein
MRGVIRVTLGLAPPQSRAINGNQWQSMAIKRQSMAISGNQWLSVAINWQSMYQGHFEANPHRGQLGGARV